MRINTKNSPLWKKILGVAVFTLSPFVYVLGLLTLAAYCTVVIPVTLPLIFVGAIYHIWGIDGDMFERINKIVLWIYHPLVWVIEKAS